MEECRRWWIAAKEHFDTNELGRTISSLSGAVVDGHNRQTHDALQRDEYENFYKRLVFAFNNDGAYHAICNAP